MLIPVIKPHRLGPGLSKEDDNFLQRPRIFNAGDLAAVGLEDQRIGLVARHLESLHKLGAAISCVQVHDDKPLGQFRERPVRVRVLLENPAMFPS